MIPYDNITAWGVTHPWPSRDQIEQDLLLSRAICDIYSNSFLSDELIFRGGTALHKLILNKPFRYSEDLDFVRTSSGGIGNIMKELTKLGKQSGYSVSTKINMFPKVFWKTLSQTGHPIKIKLEINTYERAPVLPITKIAHNVENEWFSNNVDVNVMQIEEIAATKLRALFQRAKGRDLFDLWLMTNEEKVDAGLVCNVFSTYRPDRYTVSRAIDNLKDKLDDEMFRIDIINLISQEDVGYKVETAAEMVIDKYLSKL